MINFEIFFDNGGGATLQTQTYTHYYVDMVQLASDVKEIVSTGDTSDWDGNQPEQFISIDAYDTAPAGSFIVLNQNNYTNKIDTGWKNIEEFHSAIQL